MGMESVGNGRPQKSGRELIKTHPARRIYGICSGSKMPFRILSERERKGHGIQFLNRSNDAVRQLLELRISAVVLQWFINCSRRSSRALSAAFSAACALIVLSSF